MLETNYLPTYPFNVLWLTELKHQLSILLWLTGLKNQSSTYPFTGLKNQSSTYPFMVDWCQNPITYLPILYLSLVWLLAFTEPPFCRLVVDVTMKFPVLKTLSQNAVFPKLPKTTWRDISFVQTCSNFERLHEPCHSRGSTMPSDKH